MTTTTEVLCECEDDDDGEDDALPGSNFRPPHPAVHTHCGFKRYIIALELDEIERGHGGEKAGDD